METKKDCPYKKRQFSPCFVKSTSSPLGAMCSQETGAWCGGKEHGTFSRKMPATLMMQRDILSVQTAWQLDPLQGLGVKVWEIEKKKKNGYGNILLNEYNKDSRRSKEGRDLQEEIEIKQRLISGWSERGKRQGKHISQEKDLRCRRRPAGWRWILWRTGDRKHISKDTRVCSPQMMERKRGTTHSERMDGKPNTENENSRARRRTSSRNRLSAGEDKSRRNTGKSATQGRKS